MKKKISIFGKIKLKIRFYCVFKSLAFLTKAVIKKRKVKVIGVTGSLGKTTTVNFIATVLRHKFSDVYISKEVTTGVPTFLAIFGYKQSLELRKQFLGLIYVFYKALWILLNNKVRFWSYLVLELRCDYDGKNLYLLTHIFQPEVRVVTAVEIVHAETLGNLSQIASRKRALVECACLDTHYAVLNYDDSYVRNMSNCTVAKIIYYGQNEKADFRALEAKIDQAGLSFKLKAEGTDMLFGVPKILDKVHVYSILTAIIIGRIFKMSWDEIRDAVSLIEPIEGRGNVVAGIKNSSIINNTFNANIRSMKAAIDSLATFSNEKRKVAVLGDMLELHKFSDQCHRDVGKAIDSQNVNFLVTIGDDSRKIEEEAIKNGVRKENTRHYADVDEAMKEVKDLIRENDVVLVKASHGIELDKLVKFLSVKNN